MTTETWLPWCIKRPGPDWKKGYSGNYYRGLDEIEGEVKHSAEGYMGSLLFELERPDREASWHFSMEAQISNPSTGEAITYQHYPLEWILWHCGRAGDRRVDTSLIGNVTLVGIEHVDRWTGGTLDILLPHQVKATAHITSDLRRLCPRVQANPPTLRRNLWEHNWLSSTACPSGLIPWNQVISLIKEDDMFEATDREVLNAIRHRVEGHYVRVTGAAAVYLFDGERLIHQSLAGFVSGVEADWGDIMELPADNLIWRHPVTYPLGLPDQMRR